MDSTQKQGNKRNLANAESIVNTEFGKFGKFGMFFKFFMFGKIGRLANRSAKKLIAKLKEVVGSKGDG